MPLAPCSGRSPGSWGAPAPSAVPSCAHCLGRAGRELQRLHAHRKVLKGAERSKLFPRLVIAPWGKAVPRAGPFPPSFPTVYFRKWFLILFFSKSHGCTCMEEPWLQILRGNEQKSSNPAQPQ